MAEASRRSATVRARVDFELRADMLAIAMAIEARDESPRDDDASLAEYVRHMSRADAMRALRACLVAYGALSWPDDYSDEAARVARDRIARWGYA